ncbi:MAG: hypothetical protein ACXVAY_16700 [Mucilaginibacter sp.]
MAYLPNEFMFTNIVVILERSEGSSKSSKSATCMADKILRYTQNDKVV